MQFQEFFPGIAVVLAGIIVDRQEVPFQIEDVDGIDDVVNDGAIAGLTLTQGDLGGLDLGGALRHFAL